MNWIEKDMGVMGRVREAGPSPFVSGRRATAVLRTGVKAPPLRRPSIDGSVGQLLTRIGKEDRTYLAGNREAPLGLICQLRAFDDVSPNPACGTGFLVSSRVVVTAAHCLLQAGFKAVRAEVTPGLRVTDPPYATQEVGSRSWTLHPSWKGSGSPVADMAIITLPEDAGVGCWFGMAALSDDALSDRMINIAGYPAWLGDRGMPDGIPEEERCRRLYHHGDRIKHLYPDRLKYDADTSGGQSGAPIILMPTADDPWSGPTAIGIHVHGVQNRAEEGDEVPDDPSYSNCAARITCEFMDMIRAAVLSAESQP